ncbi:cell division topological specificity factor like protein [Quercus suber]|uniref:Cell division topological specificity factor like protein n=1 Tax=Quercus suber TaxID=58331 RepID=A0AAW0K9X8_QUESU
MAICGDLRVSATLGSYHAHPLRSSLRPSKVEFSGFLNGGSSISDITSKWPSMVLDNHNMRGHSKQIPHVTGDYKLSPKSISQAAESFLLDAINMSFLERLNLAWKIVFPSPTSRKNSNARIAKQRLKMILFSDRCAVSDEAKQKIVKNIVQSLSDFVEIESRDKVQLSVSTDSDLGTIYSVTVPVRRVKPEYQDLDEAGTITNIEYKDTGDTSVNYKNIVQSLSDFVEIESRDKVQLSVSTDSDLGTIYSVTVPVRRVKPEYQDLDEAGTITNIEYKDTGDTSGSVDVRFDFFIPDERSY